jgi:molybdenum cofactor biosynthesis enzyme MoaA
MSVNELERFIDSFPCLKVIALGGGEPTLHSHIIEVINLLKDKRLTVGLTTNGLFIPQYEHIPDAVHVSFDSIHKTNPETLKNAIRKYRDLGVKRIGINHVVVDIRDVKPLFDYEVDNVLLILHKPIIHSRKELEPIKELAEIKKDVSVLVDSCMAKYLWNKKCWQGITSVCLNQFGLFKKCSNVKTTYTQLNETIKDRECIITQ